MELHHDSNSKANPHVRMDCGPRAAGTRREAPSGPAQFPGYGWGFGYPAYGYGMYGSPYGYGYPGMGFGYGAMGYGYPAVGYGVNLGYPGMGYGGGFGYGAMNYGMGYGFPGMGYTFGYPGVPYAGPSISSPYANSLFGVGLSPLGVNSYFTEANLMGRAQLRADRRAGAPVYRVGR